MATRDTKKVVEKEKEVLLLSEEEFERRRRAKTKEQINRILRVFGLFAVILIIYAGVLDPFFEMSFFGFIIDRNGYKTFWNDVWPQICGRNGSALAAIYDDPMWFGDWLPKLAITLIIVAVVLGIVYLITYNVIDLISVVKGVVKSSKDVVTDLRGTLVDTTKDEFGTLPKARKKKLFSGEDYTEEKRKDAQAEKEKKKVKRRSDDLIDGLSEDQLDRLLRGEDISSVQSETNQNQPETEKQLFE